MTRKEQIRKKAGQSSGSQPYRFRQVTQKSGPSSDKARKTVKVHEAPLPAVWQAAPTAGITERTSQRLPVLPQTGPVPVEPPQPSRRVCDLSTLRTFP